MSMLAEKVAVVTGASKGIGAAIAQAMAAAGANVVVNYAQDRKGADATVAAIVATGGKATAVQGSVARAADVERLFAETLRLYGRLDVLVNNAGVYDFGALDAIDEAHFRSMFDTNVLGLLLATKEAARHLAEGGSIINVGSVVTRLLPPASAVYAATKASVEAITGVLAKELAPRRIRVNAINPGGVVTEGTQAKGIIGSDFEAQMVSQTPLGRIGQPGDIAPVAVFLASDAAAWVTGETLIVSGGMR